jgi:hypothetical protein
MKTDELIRAIAQDASARRPSLAGRVAAALGLGGAVAAGLFLLGLGVRPDIGFALETWRFVFKMALALTFAVLAWGAALRLARPETSPVKAFAGLFLVPLALALGVASELLTVPPAEWQARAVGTNARVCLVAIPLLSVALLVALLAALRAGAPRSPAASGAAAGLLAGAVAASLYATHCTDDSPLFVALWYTVALVPVVLAATVAGHRVLRW